DGRVGEVGLALATRRLEGALGLAGTADDAQPLAAAAGGRLDRDRPANLLSEAQDGIDGGDGIGSAGDDRDAHGMQRPAGRGLRAHQLDRLGRWADPNEADGLARARKTGVLREEAVTGMDGLGSRADGSVEQPILVEVALRGRARSDHVRLI